MRKQSLWAILVAGSMLALASVGQGADISGLKEGAPGLKSAGPLTFGPEGVLLVGDFKAATVFAIDTGDTTGDPSSVTLNVPDVPGRVAKLLGAGSSDVQINDMAVNPLSGNVYFSVTKAGEPAIVWVAADGSMHELSLKSVAFSKAVLPDAPEDKVIQSGRRPQNRRNESITDLAFVDGQILVSGLSAAGAPSTVRSLSFPPSEADKGTSLEIYHGAHGKLEDYAAIRTFVPFLIGGEQHLLAAYTCTPLVKVPVASLVPGNKVSGTTVAELGNRNQPLDMIVYKKDGKDFLLMANSARGVMKVSTENIAEQAPITSRVEGGGTAGQSYESIKQLDGVVQLDRLNEKQAVVLQQGEGGSLTLRSVPLP